MASPSLSPRGVPAVHQKTTSSASIQRPSSLSISSPDSTDSPDSLATTRARTREKRNFLNILMAG